MSAGSPGPSPPFTQGRRRQAPTHSRFHPALACDGVRVHRESPARLELGADLEPSPPPACGVTTARPRQLPRESTQLERDRARLPGRTATAGRASCVIREDMWGAGVDSNPHTCFPGHWGRFSEHGGEQCGSKALRSRDSRQERAQIVTRSWLPLSMVRRPPDSDGRRRTRWSAQQTIRAPTETTQAKRQSKTAEQDDGPSRLRLAPPAAPQPLPRLEPVGPRQSRRTPATDTLDQASPPGPHSLFCFPPSRRERGHRQARAGDGETAQRGLPRPSPAPRRHWPGRWRLQRRRGGAASPWG